MGGAAVVVGVAEVSLLIANHLQRLAELQQRSGQASQTAHSEERNTVVELYWRSLQWLLQCALHLWRYHTVTQD